MEPPTIQSLHTQKPTLKITNRNNFPKWPKAIFFLTLRFQLQLRTQEILHLGRPHSRSAHLLLLAFILTRLLLQLLFLDCCKLLGISQGAKKSSKGVTWDVVVILLVCHFTLKYSPSRPRVRGYTRDRYQIQKGKQKIAMRHPHLFLSPFLRHKTCHKALG